jgi:hypothetical protein
VLLGIHSANTLVTPDRKRLRDITFGRCFRHLGPDAARPRVAVRPKSPILPGATAFGG